MATPLILKRAPIGDNQEDYDVLENGVVVGRIFHLEAAAPEGRPWMWASGHGGHHIERAAHGYAETRELLARNSRKSPQRFTLGSKPFMRPLVKHPRTGCAGNWRRS